MNPWKIIRQVDAHRFCARTEQIEAASPNRFLSSLQQIFIVFSVYILITGCAPYPSKYEIHPTLSMEERLADRKICPKLTDKDYRQKIAQYEKWTKHFYSALDDMERGEWKPSSKLLEEKWYDTAKQYGLSTDKSESSLAKKAFCEKFRLDDNPCRDSVDEDIKKMLVLIDREHPNLLVECSRLKPPFKIESIFTKAIEGCRLPPLMSDDYPACVAVTPWTTPPSEKSEDKDSDETNAVITAPLGSTISAKLPEKSKSSDKKQSMPEDFKSRQDVTLSVSSVLNSSSVFDRIEYVSTYFYLEPFPFPPNGDVVLEEEFWKRFFALNEARNPKIKNDEQTKESDMFRTIEDMRVHIVNVETTVRLQDLDFGSMKRSTSDKLTADVRATTIVPFTTGPGLSYTSEVSTETLRKLRQQLDQRSTYIDPSGKFLRITQRGVQSANLAGRFTETITLFIPAAQSSFSVLTPLQKDGADVVYKVKGLSGPLYSRVDAFVVSVVVARQATALAKSTQETYGLEDPKDAALIAGVTRPYRITLWQNDRRILVLTTGDIFGNEKDMRDQEVFFTSSKKSRPAPLQLFGFTSEQLYELLRKIQDIDPDKSTGIISFPLGDGITIDIGLPDDPNEPTKLIGFK